MSTDKNKMAREKNERGATLLAMCVMIVAIIGMLALAFDLGRAYLTRNEAQAFTDSAALEGTLELDGTMDGIYRAQTRIASNENRWNFGRESYSTVTVSYAKSKDGPWDPLIYDASDYRYVRVSTEVALPLTFFPAVASSSSAAQKSPVGLLLVSDSAKMNIRADSDAGQEIREMFREGLFPFSPFAHDTIGPHFGLVPGQKYTLRWAANPTLKNENTCEGDRSQAMIDLAQAGGGSERGYIEETSASLIRETILYDYQTVQRTIGESVNMTGGAKQAMRDALIDRAHQDTDSTSTSFEEYVANDSGNGRRLVGVPINTGAPDYRIVQIGAFFLAKQEEYAHGGNKPFCAEYVGAWLMGSKSKAAGDAGSFVARLIR